MFMPEETLGNACSIMLKEWLRAGRAHRTGVVLSNPSEGAVGCPIRFQVSGIGDSRSLSMRPRPVPMQARSDLNTSPVAHCGAPFDVSGGVISPRYHSVESSKPVSGGGEVIAFSSHNDKPYRLMVRLTLFQARELLRDNLSMGNGARIGLSGAHLRFEFRFRRNFFS